MATQTLYTTGTTSISKGSGDVGHRMDFLLDFTKATVAQNDVLKVLALPKGCAVLITGVTIITPATASTTMSVGDSGSGTRYSTTLDITQAANTLIAPAVYTQHYYTAADYVSVTIGGAAPTVGKVIISAFVLDMDGTDDLPAGVASL